MEIKNLNRTNHLLFRLGRYLHFDCYSGGGGDKQKKSEGKRVFENLKKRRSKKGRDWPWSVLFNRAF